MNEVLIPTPEAIRLIVWDLDDTFWKGTLSEGDIAYVRDHHDIVIALARRGIMSSICSKNDLEPVRERLTQEQIWDYFIFPSVSWEPKGERLKGLIEAVQLRPESVLLIDDNPMNLAEAQFYVPGIQISDESIIPQLLSHPLCKGKDDSALSRLNQYRLLQKRSEDGKAAAGAGAGNADFLRASNIRVSIEYDVRVDLDRAVELINRTNQLNFTKTRLSEDRATAGEELTKLVKDYRSLSGLIRVQDNYGDYGYCGIFVIRQNQHGDKLLHFCFSCRAMNMGVETWVYHHLGRPKLKIAGDVAVDLFAQNEPIDWITLVDPAGANDQVATIEREFDNVYLRGSCDLRPLAHFFGSIAGQVHGEFTFMRDGAIFRPDHSLLTSYAAQRVDRAFAEMFAPIGLTHAELSSAMFDPAPGRNIYLLSFNADIFLPVYRHLQSGKLMAYPSWEKGKDVVRQSLAKNGLPAKKSERIICELIENYVYFGTTHEAIFRRNVRTILDAMPQGGMIVLLLLNESDDDPSTPIRKLHNESMRLLARKRPEVVVLNLADYVRSPDERHEIDHFDRRVYTRFFEHVRDLARERLAAVPLADESGGSRSALEPAVKLEGPVAAFSGGPEAAVRARTDIPTAQQRTPSRTAKDRFLRHWSLGRGSRPKD